jgi:hypothetical protein
METVGEVGLDRLTENEGSELIRGFGMRKYSVVSMMIQSRLVRFGLPFPFLSEFLLLLASPLLLPLW